MEGLHWSALAILTSFFWGCVNLADKTILSRYKLSPWDYLALDGFVGLLPLVFILMLSSDVLAVSAQVIVFAVCSGLALASFSILYFYALHMSDVRVVVILIQIIPVFSLIWGLVFLREHYENVNYAGMLLILLGAGAASLSERNQKDDRLNRIRPTKALIASVLMLLAAFVTSIGFLVQKLALEDTSTLSVFFWQRTCLVLVSFFILVIRGVQIRQSVPIVLTSLVEIVNLLGVLSIIAAYSEGPLALVSFLSSLQPLWVIGITWILSSVSPRAIPISKDISLLQLIIASVLVVSGLYLISL